MKMLKAKLYQLKLEEQEREMVKYVVNKKKLVGEAKFVHMFSILILW